MSLPTKEQFEELKKKRKQDLEQKRTMERQVHGAQPPGHPVACCLPALILHPSAAESPFQAGFCCDLRKIVVFPADALLLRPPQELAILPLEGLQESSRRPWNVHY